MITKRTSLITITMVCMIFCGCKKNSYLDFNPEYVNQDNEENTYTYQDSIYDLYESQESEYRWLDEYKTILYEALPSDTLYSIARKYSASPKQVIEINKIHKPYIIKPGQLLKIPVPITSDKDTSNYDTLNHNNTHVHRGRSITIQPKSIKN